MNLRLPPCEVIAVQKTKNLAGTHGATKSRSGTLGNSYWTRVWTRIRTSENLTHAGVVGLRCSEWFVVLSSVAGGGTLGSRIFHPRESAPMEKLKSEYLIRSKAATLLSESTPTCLKMNRLLVRNSCAQALGFGFMCNGATSNHQQLHIIKFW